MITFKGYHGTTINYNSDLSGSVFIKNESGELAVFGEDLLIFFVMYFKNKLIDKFESLNIVEWVK